MNGGFAVLAASCKPLERRLFLLFFFVFVGIGALVAAAEGPAVDVQRRGAEMAVVVAVPAFVLWAGWASRMLVLLLHARSLRIPGLQAKARDGMLVMACATILLPGLACVAYGGLPGMVFGALVLAAASGLLFALAPRGLAPFVGFGPLALSMLGRVRPDGLPMSVVVPAVAAVLVLLVALRGIAVARNATSAGETTWAQPMLFATAARGSFWGGRDLLDARAQLATLPDWARRSDGIGRLGPAWPSRSLRSLLGGVFAPMEWRRMLVSAVIWAATLVFLWFYMVRGADARQEWDGLVFMSLFTGGALLIAPLSMRLQALRQRQAGELAEAALLPGWGDGVAARRLLLRATSRIHAAWFLGFVAWMVACTWFAGRMAVLPTVLVATTAMGTLGVAAWMRPLSGKSWKLTPWAVAVALLVGTPVAAVTLLATSADGKQGTAILAGLAIIAVAGASAGHSLRRFNAMPHPFLMD